MKHFKSFTNNCFGLLSVNVVSEIFLRHRKDGYVCQGTDVGELLKLVLHQPGVDAAPENDLSKFDNKKYFTIH